jgi:hypothetical protein
LASILAIEILIAKDTIAIPTASVKISENKKINFGGNSGTLSL